MVIACLAPRLVIAQGSATTAESVPGEFIVHFRAPDPATRVASSRLYSSLPVHERIARLSRVLQTTVRREREVGHPRTRVYELGDRSPSATRRALASLRRHPDVLAVEPNYIRQRFLKPNDTHYPLQWYTAAIRLEQAWDKTTGSEIVIAIVDTGIRNHPDLVGRLLPGYDFITDATSANDGNGWDNDPTDTGDNTGGSSAFHGTHVAGIIGASANNGQGVAGVSWRALIVPVRALGVKEGKGTDSDIAAAIRWAAGIDVPGAPKNARPAKIINLSFGGPGESKTLSDAVSDAQARGVIVVAAAGNQGINGQNVHPAAINNVVTVGATGYSGKRASYSNYGTIIDIMAPGGELAVKLPITYQGKTGWEAGIVSTMYYIPPRNEYSYHLYEGTSQASPIVAGVISLMLTVNPSLTLNQILGILRNTANPSARCTEGCGPGLLDAAAAVDGAKTPPADVPPGQSGPAPFGTRCSIDAQCADQQICRAVVTGEQICTRLCSLAQNCPAGGNCQQGLCVPTFATPSNNNNIGTPGQGLEGATIEGTACALDPNARSERSSSWWLFPLLLLGLWVGRRCR